MSRCRPTGEARKIQGPPPRANGCGEAPDISRIRNKYLDVPYAKVSAAEKMDIYLPDMENSYPVIIKVLQVEKLKSD